MSPPTCAHVHTANISITSAACNQFSVMQTFQQSNTLISTGQVDVCVEKLKYEHIKA